LIAKASLFYMFFADILTQFGYPVLSLGTIIEGDAALLCGGILAKQGYFAMFWVMSIAFLTTLACDQFFFFLGRLQGSKALKKWPKLGEKSQKVIHLVQKNHLWLAVFFRFLYGFRSITPFAIGLCKISPIRFLVLNLLGISLWVSLLTWAGYLFGHALELLLQSVPHWELWIICGLAAAGIVFWAFTSLGRWMVGKMAQATP
jgi:membrane protein DedA with SNARE-associated domain